jgi:hypothetical protein
MQTPILNVIAQVFTFDTTKDDETRAMKVSKAAINQLCVL